jgi:4-cresol dehydrogenase (hydroxylating)
MQPAAVRRYANLVHTVTAAHGTEPLITFTTVSDRLFDSTVPILFDQSDAEATAAAQRCYAALLAEGRTSGFFPYRFGIGGMASLLDLAPEAAAFNRRIQAAHDPQQLLAPGRYR